MQRRTDEQETFQPDMRSAADRLYGEYISVLRLRQPPVPPRDPLRQPVGRLRRREAVQVEPPALQQRHRPVGQRQDVQREPDGAPLIPGREQTLERQGRVVVDPHTVVDRVSDQQNLHQTKN